MGSKTRNTCLAFQLVSATMLQNNLYVLLPVLPFVNEWWKNEKKRKLKRDLSHRLIKPFFFNHTFFKGKSRILR